MLKKFKIKSTKTYSVLITLLVLGIVLLSSFGTALTISGQADKSTYNIEDASVQLSFSVDIQTDERVPLQNFTIDIFNSTDDLVKSCTFDMDGTNLTSCDYLTIQTSTNIEDEGNLSANGSTNDPVDFGYGYGYGYGYGFSDEGYTGEINVSATWNFTGEGVNSDNYSAEIYFLAENGGTPYTFEQSNDIDFQIDLSDYIALEKSGLTNSDILKANSAISNITTNLDLIQVGTYGTSITWTSNNSAIRAIDGKVTRPTYGQGNVSVLLNATISKSGYTSDYKTFIATVVEETQTDAAAVTSAKTNLIFGVIKAENTLQANVSTDLDLITQGTDGTTISWTSSNENIITKQGSVSRQSTNKDITLTATISKGASSTTKPFIITVYGTLDADTLSVNGAKSQLNLSRILNGNIDKENIRARLYFRENFTNYPNVTIVWNSSNTAVINNTGFVTRSNSQDVTVQVNATLNKNSTTTIKQFTFIVKKKVAPIVQQQITTTSGQTEVVVDLTNGATVQNIDVPSTVDDDEAVVLNFEAVINTSGNQKTTTLVNQLNMSRKTTTANYSVSIPAGTQVQGDSSWNGLVQLPTVINSAEMTAPSVSGKTTSVDSVIEVGLSGIRLNFTQPIKILLEGMTGKNAAFSIDGTQLSKITTQCTNAAGAGIPAAGECYYDDGTDLIIWTYHFTKFSAYTETTVEETSSTSTTTSTSIGSVTPTNIVREMQTFLIVSANTPTTITWTDENLVLTKMVVTSSKPENYAKFTSMHIEEPTKKLQGTVYQYLTITAQNFESITNAKIDFKISKTWMTENKIKQTDIALYRYTNQWDELQTTLLSDDTNYYYYEANSPGFSEFAIATKGIDNTQEKELIDEKTQEKETNTTTTDVAPIVDDSTPKETSPNNTQEQENKGDYTTTIFVIIVILLLLIYTFHDGGGMPWETKETKIKRLHKKALKHHEKGNSQKAKKYYAKANKLKK
ncbi:PGF-pre-PGF domain-containing protein [Candidatus Woesearchaeota archaeon]|nr:PGF-pre-PGF domain-containing protein [Candidatus Woesearchaeota archaeon]MCF7900756.1 PGF-pre-PGF domain-containing protein [Candidatus Woesearchaeota archaeon]MCF8012921.1 PGF-pre-PGF domain-containing protein [Candidatus Woesearchaeota archaeon]